MTSVEDAFATLGAIGSVHADIGEHLTHHEVYTWEGLLTLLWHGEQSAADVVLACGGALGGVLGPGGLYQRLGSTYAERGIGTVRVGYRVPNNLDACVHDLLAAADLAVKAGARRIVCMGHSFGGAVAIQAAAALGERCRGVVTFATQSGGAELGEQLGEASVPCLHIHGDADTVLPFFASQMVQMLTGGELMIIPGGDHALGGAREEIWAKLEDWLAPRLGR